MMLRHAGPVFLGIWLFFACITIFISYYVLHDQHKNFRIEIDQQAEVLQQLNKYSPGVGPVSHLIENALSASGHYRIEKLNGDLLSASFAKEDGIGIGSVTGFFYTDARVGDKKIRILGKPFIYDNAIRVVLARNVKPVRDFTFTVLGLYLVMSSAFALGGWRVVRYNDERIKKQIEIIASNFHQLSIGEVVGALPTQTRARTINEVNHAFNLARDSINQHISMRQFFQSCLSHEVFTELSFAQRELEQRAALQEDEDMVLNNLILARNKLDGVFDVAEFLANGHRGFEELRFDEHVQGVLYNAKNNMEYFAQNRGVQINSVLKPAVIFSSRGVVDAMVGNIVNNAIKFSPDGGRVDIRTWSDAGDRAYFRVEDSGPGLAAFPQGYNFKNGPSAPLAGTGHPGRNNTGVGLFMVYHIVKLIGGRIEIRDREGSDGLRVDISMPGSSAD